MRSFTKCSHGKIVLHIGCELDLIDGCLTRCTFDGGRDFRNRVTLYFLVGASVRGGQGITTLGFPEMCFVVMGAIVGGGDGVGF